MLKNINPEELNNRSSNSENIDDSQNINDDEQEPLCSFDISLNNGKKASLIIYDEDNYEQKVEDFCQKYKISPHVIVSLTGFDCDSQKNARVYLKALDVSTDGFNLEMATFGDSKIYYVKASWDAYGQ